MTVLRRLLGPRRPLPPAPDHGPMVAICHCHYVELVTELARSLRCLPEGAAVHVTSSRPEVFEAWRRADAGRTKVASLHLSENRGRDIRPFFECAAKLELTPETLVLKIHGKKSLYTKAGDRWRRNLLRGLLAGRHAAPEAAARFCSDPALAMLGPPGAFISHPVYWGRNRAAVGRFLQEACGVEPAESDLGFFAGSMFWIRGAYLMRFARHVDLAAFEPEPLPEDGAYAHMIERVIGMAAPLMGFGLAEIGRAGRIAPHDVATRKIGFI